MIPNTWRRPRDRSTSRRTTLLAASTGLALSTLAPSIATAAEREIDRRQQCERRGTTRVVELREEPESGLPCEVVYLKPDEDGSESALWTARTDRAFCTARFEAFVVKLESKLDWMCEAVDVAPIASRSTEPTTHGAAPPGTRAVVEPETEAARDEATLAAASAPTVRADERLPALGGALPATGDDVVPGEPEGDAPAPFERLRAFAPPGTYVAVPMPSAERENDVRVASWCPPAGRFAWKGDDASRPVFALGETIEFVVRVPEAGLEETSVLPIVSSVGEGVTRELQTLSSAASESDGRSIDVRVAPRGPGSGALSPIVCRYALEE